MTDRLILTLGILGGTGKEGQGLAIRWAKAGYHVIIGSREEAKAKGVASELNQRLGRQVVEGQHNAAAAGNSDILVLTVPYSAQKALLEEVKPKLQGKLLVSVSVPLMPPDVSTVQMPAAGSASQEAQQVLGEGVKVVAAFQNVSHILLLEDGPVDCDVLVCGDSQTAKNQVLQLVEAAGLTGWDAGPLQNAVVVEGLTSVLLGINKRHSIKHAGIRITGEPK